MEQAVQAWEEEFQSLHQRIARHFVRSEPRSRALAYLKGLTSPCQRKNGWQLAEMAQESCPDGMQRLLNQAHWDADAVRDELRQYVVEQLGDAEAVLVIDETGFVKKGSKSVGVQRQYSGTAGRIENCQVGVFLAYVSEKGSALMDRALYLPQEWAADQLRRKEAGVPQTVQFATKPELARQMLERALKAAVAAAWVTGDSIYGGDRKLRLWQEEQGQPFVLAVSSKEVLWMPGFKQVRVDKTTAGLRQEDWHRLSAGRGAKGERLYRLGLAEAGPTADHSRRPALGTLAVGAPQYRSAAGVGLLRCLWPGTDNLGGVGGCGRCPLERRVVLQDG